MINRKLLKDLKLIIKKTNPKLIKNLKKYIKKHLKNKKA